MLVGVGLGITYGVLGFIKIIVKHNYIVTNIINLIYSLGCGMVVLLVTINLNFGEFRAFVICGVVLGIIIERKTLGKIFAKIFLLMYNKFSKCIIALKNTKVVKKILK